MLNSASGSSNSFACALDMQHSKANTGNQERLPRHCTPRCSLLPKTILQTPALSGTM
ncbi:hypothetical protein [Thiolapillus sp.]|uniref:hypothetical protein n=1 Tax=Thiolapillus sp. TaxID=2017437 RepID=UPI0025D631EF|nr:hypothetical protein [Thiolapillus sp.]